MFASASAPVVLSFPFFSFVWLCWSFGTHANCIKRIERVLWTLEDGRTVGVLGGFRCRRLFTIEYIVFGFNQYTSCSTHSSIYSSVCVQNVCCARSERVTKQNWFNSISQALDRFSMRTHVKILPLLITHFFSLSLSIFAQIVFSSINHFSLHFFLIFPFSVLSTYCICYANVATHANRICNTDERLIADRSTST